MEQGRSSWGEHADDKPSKSRTQEAKTQASAMPAPRVGVFRGAPPPTRHRKPSRAWGQRPKAVSGAAPLVSKGLSH